MKLLLTIIFLLFAGCVIETPERADSGGQYFFTDICEKVKLKGDRWHSDRRLVRYIKTCKYCHKNDHHNCFWRDEEKVYSW